MKASSPLPRRSRRGLPPSAHLDASAPARSARARVARRPPIPEGGIELVLAIDASGAVTEVALRQSLGPEADAAVIAAANALKFEPARRGDQPIAARIGFRFEPAPPPPPAETRSRRSPEAAADAPALRPNRRRLRCPAPEDDLGAAGARRQAASRARRREVKLRGRELTMVPGTFGEPLRVVATLPGVARIAVRARLLPRARRRVSEHGLLRRRLRGADPVSPAARGPR